MSPALAIDGRHTIALRDYQEEALEAVAAAEEQGVRRQLMVLPTGSGKTIVFASLAARRGDRTLVLAHRDELIAQAVDKIRLVWPDADIGVVKAERNEAWAQDVVVASVQSLSPARVARLGRFGLVVADEAHHCSAKSWTRILNDLGCGPDVNSRTPDGPLLLGVTATPDRADGKGLNETFDRIVYAKDILWMIRAGYLADIRAKEIELAELHLEDVTVRQGDYAEGELGAAMTKANAPRHILKAWRQHASDRRTLVFMPTVANAQEVAAEFLAGGVRAVAVAGSDPIDERRRKMADFSAGRVQVLVNCMIASEGYDNPAVDCIVMGRPTKSRALFSQCIGRGLRPFPGKDDLLVLDVVGDSSSLDLCSVPSLFGLTKRQMRERPATQAVADKEAAEAEQARLMAVRPTVPDARLVARDVELFKRARELGKVAWAPVGGGYAVSAGRASVILEAKGDDLFSVLVVTGGKGGATEVLMDRVPLTLAQGIAEDHIRRKVAPALVNKEAAWRSRKPTVKAIDAAKRMGITVDPDWSAGRLSQAIDARLAQLRRRSSKGA